MASMTPDEFRAAMEELLGMDEVDEEAAHAKADDLIANVLESLGYEEGVEMYRRIHRWCG